jgi:ubiquinol-cytochrome c reductase cytochrome b subunit
MIRRLSDWLDHRVGSRGMMNAMLYEHIPGGSRWRYVWGSTLIFAFTVQLITGFFLWACYSPSAQTAWESVYYIQHQMYGGWLLRGIHHFMAQAMVVLLGLHLAQVIIDGAYRAPREINFWIGLILMQVVMGLSLTGYLLPWDQKGYWATQVATNIMGIVPVIGPYLQRVLIGGTNYGHLTLTRFFALHAGLLPFMLMGLTAVHVYVFRRHGLTAKEPYRAADSHFWPDQVLKDAIACLAVMLVVVLLVLRPWIFSAGHEAPGAELGAPADPSVPYSAARPEWYFLFLFQFLKLKYFAGPNEIIGAVIIPSLVMLVLALMPIVGRWQLGHRFNIVFFFAIGVGVIVLTSMAKIEDSRNQPYKSAVERAQMEADRAVELAESPSGIPASGAVALLRTDPFIQGPRLFSQSCASCHRFNGHDGANVVPNPQTDPQSASDLGNFASRAWIEGLLDPTQIATARYFGATRHSDGKMVHYIKDEMSGATPEKQAQVRAIAAALSAEANLKSQQTADAADAALIKQGREYITGPVGGCTDCHTFHESAGGEAPDLTGYGSRQWLIDFLHDPAHERFYGANNDRMPAYGAKHLLDATQIGLIVDWLRGEWYTPTTAPSGQE